MSKRLDVLIEKYKKSSKLNQTESNEYVKELNQIIKKNEYTDELDEVLCDGHTDLSMRVLSNYINDVDDKISLQILNNFLHSEKLRNNASGGATIRLCNLLKYIRTSSKRKEKAEQRVFLFMVKYSYKADNSINGTALKTIRKTILPMFKDKRTMLKLDFVNKQATWKQIKEIFTTAALDNKPFDQALCWLVYKWLQSSGQPMKPYDENYMEKEIEKISQRNKADTNIPVKSVNHQEEQVKRIANENSNDENRKNQNEVVSSGQKAIQDKKDPALILAKLLNSQTEAIKILSDKIERVERKLAGNLEIIKKLQVELGSANFKYNTLYEEKKKLDEEKKRLDDENEALAQLLEVTNGRLQQLQEDYDSKSQFSDSVIKELKKNQEAFLNKLASNLKVDYSDFIDASNEKMTIDLGENMRAQLEEVFGILEKNGIRLKG